MRTSILFDKAKEIFAAFTARTPAPAIGSRGMAEPMAALQCAGEELQRPLAARLTSHVTEYSGMQSKLMSGTLVNQLPESHRLIQEAQSLAAHIASIPGYREIEPLAEAREVLVGHWRSPWSNGGISAIAYRARLTGLVLFLRSQCPET